MKSRLNVRHVFCDFPESSQVHYLEGNLPTEFIPNLGHYIRACITPVRNCLQLQDHFLWRLLKNVKTDQLFNLQQKKKKKRSHIEFVQECALTCFPVLCIDKSEYFFFLFHMGFDLCSAIISLARETSYSTNKSSIIYLLSTLCVTDIYNTWRETQALSQGSHSLEKQHSLESLARQSEPDMWTSNNSPFTFKCSFFAGLI